MQFGAGFELHCKIRAVRGILKSHLLLPSPSGDSPNPEPFQKLALEGCCCFLIHVEQIYRQNSTDGYFPQTLEMKWVLLGLIQQLTDYVPFVPADQTALAF